MTFWEHIVNQHALQIGNNDQSTPHWARNGEEYESTMDVTLAKQPIKQWTILDVRHTTCSDHVLIEWQLCVDMQEVAYLVQVIQCNLAAMVQEEKQAAKNESKEVERQSACLQEESTGHKVEREAEWDQIPLSKVLDAESKEMRI